MKPVVGHTYELKEPEYRFGVGTILVSVTKVIGETDYDSERWWKVQGHVAIGTAHNHGGWQHRNFLEVRGADLHRLRVMAPDAT